MYYLLSDIVNTKVDMRFIVDDALWLPEYVRDRLKSEVRVHRRDALFRKMQCKAGICNPCNFSNNNKKPLGVSEEEGAW